MVKGIPFGVSVYEMNGDFLSKCQSNGLYLSVTGFQQQIDKSPITFLVMDHREKGQSLDPLKDLVLEGAGVFYGHLIRLERLELIPDLGGEFQSVVEDRDEADILPFELVNAHGARPIFSQSNGQPQDPKSWRRPPSYRR